MPPPRTTDHDDEELVRYVLGLLPDEARERLDEASIADDKVAARLRTAETDLIDSYVRGQLSGATLERFESYYLSSPRRRETVRLAASFLSAVDRSVARAEPVTWKDRIARPTRFARIAAAAALVMVVCGVFLFRAERPRNEFARATSENGAVERRASEAASASSTPASASPAGKRAAPPERIVAVVLLPPTRAVAPIPTLAIPAGVDRVRLRAAARSERLSELSSWTEGSGDQSDPVAQRLDRAAHVRGAGFYPCGRAREPARAAALFARSRRPRRWRPRGGDRELHRAGRSAMIRAASLSGMFLTIALLVARPAAPSETQPQDATALDAGASIERHVAIGEEHLYRITLAAGEYAEVIIEQRGIDVVVQARREGATDHVEFQEEVRRDGQERVEVVADEGAAYILAVAPSHGIYSGTYAIRVATRRAATDSDRSMSEARRLRTSALALAKAARFKEARPLLRTCDQHQRNRARARRACSPACCFTISLAAHSSRVTMAGRSRSNAARSPSSTTPGATATRIRPWRGCELRSCCITRGSGRQAEALLRSSDAGDREHARNRPCLVCHVSQGAGEYSAITRAISTPPRRSTSARWRSWRRSARTRPRHIRPS